jgi:4-hydroxythreonine-4-phosphate dehydrogenase
MGDPCGIGPEIIVKALNKLTGKVRASFLIIGDDAVMAEAATRFSRGPSLAWLSVSELEFSRLTPGAPGRSEGKAMWEYLEAALEQLRRGDCQALVTAPVTKSAMSIAGFPYPGHTDWLAKKTGSRGVMMLAAGDFRVVPVTAHAPLARVSRLLTRKKILDAILIVNSELGRRFRIKSPRLAVAGLNPHAGEHGLLGGEESKVILPAVKEASSRGIRVAGPLPADTLFTKDARKTYDAAICMYHDQAMIPVKTIGRDQAVNVTLGLPIVRTSPAHGTAPDIAWKGKADPSSMIAAIELAVKLARP